MASRLPPWHALAVLSIGHSTRPLALFLELLARNGVVAVADVRRFPWSPRQPWFNGDALAKSLQEQGIRYQAIAGLGGRRGGGRVSGTNGGWRVAGFRAYADHLRTRAFHEGLRELHVLAAGGPVALLCSEALWWRCHRRLIADALLVRGCVVRHILGATKVEPHVLAPFARVVRETLTYPPAP
jgi:uncharacterized protein (DUF488 family)